MDAEDAKLQKYDLRTIRTHMICALYSKGTLKSNKISFKSVNKKYSKNIKLAKSYNNAKFYFKIIKNLINSCDGKAELSEVLFINIIFIILIIVLFSFKKERTCLIGIQTYKCMHFLLTTNESCK